MAIPNYTYLKLKMLGPNGVITIDASFQHAFECDVKCYEYAEAIIESEELVVDLEACSKRIPSLDRTSDTFEAIEGVKEVPLDPSGSYSRVVRISATLGPK
jgi:hypothetical protein